MLRTALVAACWLTAVAAGADEAPAPLKAVGAKLKSGEPTTIVCFGDSVTGLYYHTGGERTYTDMLGLALEKLFPNAKPKMINAGVSGNTTADGLLRIDRDVLAKKPNLVTVMFGLNDMVRVAPADYAKNLKTTIEKCRGAGADVLLCTPNNVIDTPGRSTAKLVEYCDIMRSVGKETGTPVCDCYADLEAIRTRDARTWRLLMSDQFHPNMAGHKRIAERIAQSITEFEVSLADVKPPRPLARTWELIEQGKPVKVLAMPPLDAMIGPAMLRHRPNAKLEVIPWVVEGKKLGEIAADAKERVRALKPDLVVIAVPRTAAYDTEEDLINHFTWVMNWSLSFGRAEWDCIVVHPRLLETADGERKDQDALIRQLVAAQDLTLFDRPAKGESSPAELLTELTGATKP